MITRLQTYVIQKYLFTGQENSTMAHFCHLILLVMIIHVSVDLTQSACSTACSSCTNDTCASCDVGSYLESGSCHTCPEHCTSCWNSVACYNCEAGYFGLGCERICYIQGCVNNTCDKESGRCTYGCIDGYFSSGLSCYQCYAYCKTCANFSINCQVCKEGFYGPSCQYPCSHCKDGICSHENCTHGCSNGFFLDAGHCIQCSPLCTSCDTLFNCHSCVDGYFGPSCQYKCSVCSPCIKTNGLCFPSTTINPSVTGRLSEHATSTFAAGTVRTTQADTVRTTQADTRQEAHGTTQISKSGMSTTHIISPTSRVCGQEDSTELRLNLAIAGWSVAAILAAIVMTGLIMYRRKINESKTTETLHIRSTEDHAVSQDYTTLAMETRGDGHLYSSLDNTDNTAIRE